MFTETTDMTREQIFARDGNINSFVNNDQRRIDDKFIDTFIGKKIGYYYSKFFKKTSKLHESLPLYRIRGNYGEYTTMDKMVKLPITHPVMMYMEEESLICRRCGRGLHSLNRSLYDNDICEKCSGMIAFQPRNFIEDSLRD